MEEAPSSDDFMKELQHNKSKATHMQIKKKLTLTAPRREGAHCAAPVGFLTALFNEQSFKAYFMCIYF